MHKTEKFSDKPKDKLPRYLATAATIISLALSGCSSVSRPSKKTVKNAAEPAAPLINLTPDMSGFLMPGNKTKCELGAPRPCAIRIRTEPKLASEYINVAPTKSHIPWPLEAYGGYPGDKVTIECFIPNGELIKPFEGNAESSAWYAVVVPESRILNPQILREIRDGSSDIHALRYDGEKAVIGWASSLYFNQSVPDKGLAQC